MASNHWILILGMSIVTYLPRFVPMLILNNRSVPEKLVKWMSFIPVSVFAALIFSDIFFWQNELSMNPTINAKLIPSILVFFVAYRTKSLLWSMSIGIAGISAMLLLF